MTKGKSLFLGLVIGGVAGTAIALLSSPKNSQAFKEALAANSTKVKETLNSLKAGSSQFKDQVVQASKEGSVLLKDFSKDVKASVDTWKKEIEPNKTKIMDEIKNIEESLQQLEKITKG